MTKIITTLGPSCWDEESIELFITKGVRLFRINLSHSNIYEVKNLYQKIHNIATRLDSVVTVLLDLPGHKIRVKDFTNELLLKNQFKVLGKDIIVDIPGKVKPGMEIVIGDNEAKLVCINDKGLCRVTQSGTLRSNIGVSILGFETIGLSNKDRNWLEEIRVNNVGDILIASFVNSAKDIIEIKKFSNKPIIAKIETLKGINNLNDILEICDGILIGRGDLMTQIPMEQLVIKQKEVINKALYYNQPVIVATELVGSMTNRPRPSRAEVSDVTNAILDGVDGLCLSNETAIGQYSQECVDVLNSIITSVKPKVRVPNREYRSQSSLHSMAKSIGIMVNELSIDEIIIMSKSGITAQSISMVRPKSNIRCGCSNDRTTHLINLYWNCSPFKSNKFNSSMLLNDKSYLIVTSDDPLKPGNITSLKLYN